MSVTTRVWPVVWVRCRAWMVFVLFSVAMAPAHAGGRHFGLLGKSVDDSNFVDAWRGCQAAASEQGDECVHLGAGGEAHARRQAAAVRQAVESHQYDALAISVMNSPMVRQALNASRMPVITFDSPFNADHAGAQSAYVGIDNEAFGASLGQMARQLRTAGGTICIMTAAHDTNLELRLLGARRALSGDPTFAPGKRLNGEGGWTEAPRCPFETGDSVPRTMTEINLIMAKIRPDVLLSTGHWPVIDAAAYRKTVAPYQDRLRNQRHVVVVGIGKATADITALMENGLLHGYVSIDFPNMGRESYDVMRRLVEGKTVPDKVVSPVKKRVVPPR